MWRKALKLAGTIAGTLNPGVAAAIGVVNQFLPDGKRLPQTSTGQDVIDAFDSLPAEQQAIASKRLDVELGMEQEHTKQIEAAYAHDSSGASTRPAIAKGSFNVVALVSLAFVVGLYADIELPDWPLMATILAPFVLWVNTYMNARKQEKIARYNVATGNPALGTIASIIQAFKK